MFRIALFALAMFIIAQLGDGWATLAAYRDYIMTGLLTLMIKPWVLYHFD